MLLAALAGSSTKELPQSPGWPRGQAWSLLLPDHANTVTADPALAISSVSCFLFKTTKEAGDITWEEDFLLSESIASKI